MNKLKRCGICFISCFILCVVFAANVLGISYAMDEDVYTALNSASMRACEDVDDKIVGFDIAVEVKGSEGTGNKIYCVFNKSGYDSLTKRQKKAYLSAMTDYITDGEDGLNAAQMQQAYNFLSGVDDRYINEAVSDLLDGGNNNLLTAVSIMEPAMKYLNIGFALMVLVILLLTTAVTIADIAYLSLPFLSSNTKDDKKPKFISNEAFKALTESVDKGGNVYGIYFKKRIFALILIAVCTGVILSGRLSDFIAMIVGLFM